MQRIGATLVITGLLGIPVLALMGVGVTSTTCALFWLALGLMVVCFGAWQHKGIRNWLDEPIDMEIAVPQPLLLCVGLVFAAAGIGIIVFGKPSSGPKSMSRDQMMFFGSIFVLMGFGVSLLSNAQRRTLRSADPGTAPNGNSGGSKEPPSVS